MNEDVFNTSIRKFLKTLGVTAQREIEKAVRQALAEGNKGNEKISRPGYGHARRDRVLARDQGRNRVGMTRGCTGVTRSWPRNQSWIAALELIDAAGLLSIWS